MSRGRRREKGVAAPRRRVERERIRVHEPTYVPMSAAEEKRVVNLLAAILMDALRQERHERKKGAEGGDEEQGSEQEARAATRDA